MSYVPAAYNYSPGYLTTVNNNPKGLERRLKVDQDTKLPSQTSTMIVALFSQYTCIPDIRHGWRRADKLFINDPPNSMAR